MENANLHRRAAMVEFLGCFSTISMQINELTELSDGVVMFEALSEM
jgi:hypothetical protein